MPRGMPLIVGLLGTAALLSALITFGHPGGWRRGAKPPPSASASASAVPRTEVAPNPSPDPSAGGEDPLIEPPEPGGDWGDGGKLPAGAPGSISFGVILFAYDGAQLAPKGARSKDEAREKAKAIIEEAKKDFAEAAKKGDRGSTADVGRMPRGVLEPDVENVLFSMEKGGVHPEPLDTPRGFWVVKRLD